VVTGVGEDLAGEKKETFGRLGASETGGFKVKVNKIRLSGGVPLLESSHKKKVEVQ